MTKSWGKRPSYEGYSRDKQVWECAETLEVEWRDSERTSEHNSRCKERDWLDRRKERIVKARHWKFRKRQNRPRSRTWRQRVERKRQTLAWNRKDIKEPRSGQ